MTSNISERAVIARLSIGLWSGMTVDPEVTEEVSESHKADLKGAGRYSKRLVANHYMREISSKASIARQTHRLLTLPWSDDGARILSTRNYAHYTEQMRLRRLACEAAFDAFCTPEMIENYKQEARTRLGTMFDADEYPSAEDMRKKFGFRVDIDKVPEAADFRAKLTADQVKAVTKDIEGRSNERLEKAMKDIYRRVGEVTEKMAEKLKGYEPAAEGKASGNRFRDSLVTNVIELADLMDGLNVTDDQTITDLAKRLKDELGQHSPEILRDDAKLRNATAKQAEAIYNRVKRFM